MLRPALLVLLTLLAFAACRKDEVMPTSGGSGPTPTTVALPSWVLDSIGPMPMPADNPLTVEGIALGRKLFHEKALSDNYTQSCASCHLQAHGFSDPLPFSVGTNGATGTRNAMAIINLGWDPRLFWDGRRNSLELQAHDPVTNPIEMRNTWPTVVARLQAMAEYPPLFQAAFGTSTIDSTLVTKAIAQFERTLVSFNARYDRFHFLGDSSAFTPAEMHGRDLFMRDGHCVDCHTEERLTDGAMRNNGLDVVSADPGFGAVTGLPSHQGRFKVPTLRNIAATAPYMHDSRFQTLEEVVAFYALNVHTNAQNLDAHMAPWVNGQIDLDAQEQADLVAFLHTFTDSTFLTDPAFGQP